MYYANTHASRPKNKIPASVVTTDGEIFEGYLFVSGDQRIKDMLNGDSQFIPFETRGGAMYILNRSAIARVVPTPVAAAKMDAA
jgi:hypothetical protein